MLVLRVVAAPHVTADEALPQLDPAVSHLKAFLAPLGTGFDIANLVEMGAGHGGVLS
jgi:hypothetical protein